MIGQFLCVLIIVTGIPYTCYLIYSIIRDLRRDWIHLLDTVEHGIKGFAHALTPVESLPGAVHPKDCTCWLCKPPPVENKTLTQTITGRNTQNQFPSFSVYTFTGVEEIK